MKRCITFLLAIFLSLDAHAALSVRDDTGRLVELPKPARRIVSLAPHVTELLYAAGAGEFVVGAVDYSDYPEAAKTLPRVGSGGALDLEAILALRPDLVVGWQNGNPIAVLEKLQALGIPLFRSEPRKLEDVAANLRALGHLAGTDTAATAASNDYLANLQQVRERYRNATPVTVFYQIWHQPLMTINGEHLISQVIALCGGRNVFAQQTALVPKLDVEAVLAADPQAIITGERAAHPNWRKDWQRWPNLRAVRDGFLFNINPDLTQRHTSRLLQGAEEMCALLERVRHHPSRN
jgi:iron complex transport system substrate-binding protein